MKILTAVFLTLLTASASAQSVTCFPYQIAMSRLAAIGQTMRHAGIDGNGNLIQLFVSDSGAWTIIVRLERDDSAFACPLSGGEGWEKYIPKSKKGVDS